jgi:acetyltransferase-like isoleucine patch superfamily enzyme
MVALYYSIKYRCLVSSASRIQLTSQIVFGKGTVVKPYAILQTQGGMIRTGRKCAISSFNHISTGIEDIILGDYVRLGPHVTILGGSRNFKRRDVLIIEQGSHHGCVWLGDDVLVGSGSVIMPGCRIGEGVVVGALSLVNQDIPPYAIVAGSPAKIIGERE